MNCSDSLRKKLFTHFKKAVTKHIEHLEMEQIVEFCKEVSFGIRRVEVDYFS
jgi:hypothetical protein